MDRLIWNSQPVEEYTARVQRMRRCLENEIQALADERRRILRQSGDGGDEVMNQALIRLERVIRRIDTANDRLAGLRQAMDAMTDRFEATERRLREDEVGVLYTSAVQAARSAAAQPLYLRFDSPFHTGAVEPWLSALAGSA